MCVRARAHASGEDMRMSACVCVWGEGNAGLGASAQACTCARAGLLIQYATRRRHIVCVLSESTKVFDIVINGTIFGKRVTEYKKIYLKYFSPYEEFSEILLQISKRLNVKYPLFLPDFNET